MLSPLQQRVARIVTALPAAEGFALAGGAALVLAEVVERETRDLDFFGATRAQVEHLVPELEAAIRADGLEVAVRRAHGGFAHLTINGEDGEVTELDLGVDARIRPAEIGPLGPMLALEELAADKMLALFGRAQARDFVDVAALVERFGLERLCELASEKDPASPERSSGRCWDRSIDCRRPTSASMTQNAHASPRRSAPGGTT